MKKTAKTSRRAARAKPADAATTPPDEAELAPGTDEPTKPAIADQHELLCILTDQAREGNVTAARTLLSWHRRAVRDEPTGEPASEDDWSAIYGDGNNVTPLRRKT